MKAVAQRQFLLTNNYLLFTIYYLHFNQAIGQRQSRYPAIETQQNSKKHINRLKVVAVLLTIIGIGLFAYFVYSVGVHEIYHGVLRFGIVGFAVIFGIHFIKICVRAYAWRLCVHEPYSFSIKDTIPAVVIGEAMSSTIPLGILASGTAKAVAVRNRIPLVAGLSSVATENLFYSLATSIFLIIGGVILLRGFAIDESLVLAINFLIVSVSILIVLGFLMVIRQWHFASFTCNWLHEKGLTSFSARRLLNCCGRLDRPGG